MGRNIMAQEKRIIDAIEWAIVSCQVLSFSFLQIAIILIWRNDPTENSTPRTMQDKFQPHLYFAYPLAKLQ